MSRAGLLALSIVAALWFVFLRPTSLGGPATYVVVAGESMRPSLRAGDFVLAVEDRNYRTGDVVAFRIPRGDPGSGTLVIHRIVGGSARNGYLLKGDNRESGDPWRPRGEEIAGKPLVTIPRLGLLFVFLRAPLGLAVLAGIFAFLFVAGGSRRTAGPAPTILARA